MNKESQEWKRDLVAILKHRSSVVVVLILASLIVLRLGANYWLNVKAVAFNHTVKVATLSFKNVDKTITLPGNIEAISEATLYAHVSGYLKQLLVDEGATVKKDDLLAVIEAPDIIQEFRNAKADFDFQEITRKRYLELLKQQVISQQEYDKVEASANQARARFENANSNVQYTSVRAPFSGSIARRLKYVGDFISAPTKGGLASPLFLLVNEDKLRIVVNAPQKEVGNIQVGHSVDIHVDTFPNETLIGKVSGLDALLDSATKTQRILIDIDNPKIRLRAGMFASVVLHVERKDHVPMISKAALHEDQGKFFVFAVRAGRIKKLDVALGESESGFIEVISPLLSKSEEIVTYGGVTLVDNDVVKVIKESENL